jgi:hypothetical protein
LKCDSYFRMKDVHSNQGEQVPLPCEPLRWIGSLTVVAAIASELQLRCHPLDLVCRSHLFNIPAGLILRSFLFHTFLPRSICCYIGACKAILSVVLRVATCPDTDGCASPREVNSIFAAIPVGLLTRLTPREGFGHTKSPESVA